MSAPRKARYWDEWAEDTGIARWDDGRKRLNRVIRFVNQWSLDGHPEEDVAVLLRHIDMGLQTYGAREEGPGWADALREMQAYLQGNEP